MKSVQVFEKNFYQDVKNFLLYFPYLKNNKETKKTITKHITSTWEKTIFLMDPKKPLMPFVESIFFLEVIEKVSLTTKEKRLLFTTPFLQKIKNIFSQEEKEFFVYFVEKIEELKPLIDFIKYIDFNAVKTEITKNF